MGSNLDNIILPPVLPELRGTANRKHFDERAATSTERMRVVRTRRRTEKIKRIAVLDFETDPFDPHTQAPVYPFTACLLADDIEPIVIWEDVLERFIDKLLDAIEAIDEPHTIYAHNGGKFDFMFLIHRLRGRVSFKGRAIMAAEIGIHSLRDSSHILPMKLSDWKKDNFDYAKMRKDKRGAYKNEIIEYMINDCRSLLEIVKAFVGEFGFKLTIGQAAMAELKKHHSVARLGEHTDATLRPFFYGGRVECLAGAGHFVGAYKLYDVNSMYPHSMADYQHPIGSHYSFRRRGGINAKTAFLDLSCRNYFPGGIGAFVTRQQNADGQWETTARVERGSFRTTVSEFNAAVELGLIEDIEIHQYIDCDRWGDFGAFIRPMYHRRHETKALMKEMRKNGVSEESPEYLAVRKEDIFLKFLLNNSYGKFAMNPRRFKDNYFTDPGAPRPKGYEDSLRAIVRTPYYDVWERPAPRKNFNNVGTAASITGRARAILMHGIVNAVDPIYCDTDSIICRSISNVEISDTELGAWKLEDEFDEVAIAGKKLYACLSRAKDGQKERIKVRSKGVREGALGWNDILRLLDDEVIPVIASLAPAFRKDQSQHYIPRNVQRTAPFYNRRPMERQTA